MPRKTDADASLLAIKSPRAHPSSCVVSLTGLTRTWPPRYPLRVHARLEVGVVKHLKREKLLRRLRHALAMHQLRHVLSRKLPPPPAHPGRIL